MRMEASELRDLETRLWAAADQLWANTGLKPSEFSTPVLGLIFLRYAEKRFAEAEAKFLQDGLAQDELEKSDFQAEGVLYLQEKARFSYLLHLKGSENLGKALNEAMASIEEENEDLKGVLPMRRILSTAWLACAITWNLSNVILALDRLSVTRLMKAGDMSMLTQVMF
jgi:type I restriction-modification system DNA methylase subunit